MAITSDWVALIHGVRLLGIGIVFSQFDQGDTGPLDLAARLEENLDDHTDRLGQVLDLVDANTGGDGDIDILFANFNNTNQLLTNQGGAQNGQEGAFVASTLDGGLRNSFASALGDVDGDGDLDALIANDGINQLLTNQGGNEGGTEGEFLSEDLVGGDHESRDLALADLDGDGDLDAFIANDGTNQLLFNQGGVQNGVQGEFLASDLLLGVVDSTAVALGDIDGDGDIDALVANTPGENHLLINQGRAQGGTEGEFASSALDGGQQNSLDIVLGDIDGDGDLDALVANLLSDVQLLTNDGGAQGGQEGDFIATDIEGTAGDSSTALALGDIDGDGDLDAIVANFDFTNGTGATTQLLVNQGSSQGGIEGEFLISDLGIGENEIFFDIVLGDIDDDGDLDAVLANISGSNWLLVNQGGDQFGTEGEFVATDLEDGGNITTAVALGDVDGDGTAPAVDAFGFPNINLDGLLPDAPAPEVIA